MAINDLIAEMQAVKQEYPTLTIAEVLKLFEIQALNELTGMLRSMR